jgi:hypothetical protein
MRIVRSKGPLLLAFVSALFLIAGSSAIAGHNGPPKTNHESKPAPVRAGTPVRAECEVTGSASPLSPGVSTTPTHGHYTFVDTVITCVDAPDAPGATESWGGSYDVDADGGTDGHDCAPAVANGCDNNSAVDPTGINGSHAFNDHHGETCASGWSNSHGFSGGAGGANVNKGDITVTHVHAPVNHVGTGWVKFVRHGTVVEAWGELTFAATVPEHGSGATRKFHTVLQFTPTTGDCEITPATAASLAGEATIWG